MHTRGMPFRAFSAILAVFPATLLGCGDAPCEETGVKKGDRFAFTVLDDPSQNGDCAVSHPILRVGEEFEMEAGGFHEPSDSHRCGEHAAMPPAMGEWAAATLCQEWARQLGLKCRWADCELGFVEIQVGPTIKPGQNVISDGEVQILWSRSSCSPEDEHVECIERYPVRIERL